MKKFFLSITIITSVFLITHKTQAKNPCEAILCMSAMPLVGNGSVSKGCSKAISSFFAIRAYSPTGYSPKHTAALRLKYLKSCPNLIPENQIIIMRIISVYGRLPFAP